MNTCAPSASAAATCADSYEPHCLSETWENFASRVREHTGYDPNDMSLGVEDDVFCPIIAKRGNDYVVWVGLDPDREWYPISDYRLVRL